MSKKQIGLLKQFKKNEKHNALISNIIGGVSAVASFFIVENVEFSFDFSWIAKKLNTETLGHIILALMVYEIVSATVAYFLNRQHKKRAAILDKIGLEDYEQLEFLAEKYNKVDNLVQSRFGVVEHFENYDIELSELENMKNVSGQTLLKCYNILEALRNNNLNFNDLDDAISKYIDGSIDKSQLMVVYKESLKEFQGKN